LDAFFILCATDSPRFLYRSVFFMGDIQAHLEKGLIGANNVAQLTYKTTGLSITFKYVQPSFYAVG
jgi:hypothetical protein